MSEDVAAVLRCVGPRLDLIHGSDTTRRIYQHNGVGLGGVDFAALPPMRAEIGHAVRPDTMFQPGKPQEIPQ